MTNWNPLFLCVLCILAIFTSSCATAPLDKYAAAQKRKVVSRSAYNQADFDFWAALYEPTAEDLDDLKEAWVAHGEAFPISQDLGTVMDEVQKTNQRVVLISLFMTDYMNADLKNKSLGWAVFPVPFSITELSEKDVPLRTLMPIPNPWARYFLLRYSPETWQQAGVLVVSNRTSKISLNRKK